MDSVFLTIKFKKFKKLALNANSEKIAFFKILGA